MLEKLEVPRIQFLDRLVDIPVGLRWRCTVQHCAEDRGVPQGPVPGYGVDVLVVVQRQVPYTYFCVYLAFST